MGLNPNMSEAQSLLEILKQRRTNIFSWLSECKSPLRFGEISDFHTECLQKDTLSWAGYSCLAAHLAQDQITFNKRCNDVLNSQGSDGRWWRGPGRVGIEDIDSFSRDMSLGLASWSIALGESAKAPLENWLDWIETNENGLRMCKIASDNRCNIRGNTKNIFKKIISNLNLDTGDRAKYKVIKKFKSGFAWTLWYPETIVTPVGYQLHFKAIELWLMKTLGIISDDRFKTIAKVIFEKDPFNPFYEYLYLGISPELVDKVLMMCPSTRSVIKTVPHSYGGDWIWQRNSKDRAWEIANGHDCVSLLNLMVAELQGELSFPRPSKLNNCSGSYIASLNDKKVCKNNSKRISKVECLNLGGSEWTKNSKKWCLRREFGFYSVQEISTICPSGLIKGSDFNQYITCEKKNLKSIRLSQCNGEYLAQSLPKGTASQLPTHCYLNHGQWYERRVISGICPIGRSFKNELVWGGWPVCSSIRKMSSSDCVGKWDMVKTDACWVQKDGWFEEVKWK